jgi:hypothetical protein
MLRILGRATSIHERPGVTTCSPPVRRLGLEFEQWMDQRVEEECTAGRRRGVEAPRFLRVCSDTLAGVVVVIADRITGHEDELGRCLRDAHGFGGIRLSCSSLQADF